MEPIEPADVAAGEGAEENHDFAGEGGEAGESERSHGGEAEEESEFRGEAGHAAELGKLERAGAA